MKAHQAALLTGKEAPPSNRRINDFAGIVNGVNGLSCVGAATGADDRALRLAAAAGRLSGEGSVHSDPWLRGLAEAAEQRSRSRFGVRKSEEAWKEGWALSTKQGIDYALDESCRQSGSDVGPLS